METTDSLPFNWKFSDKKIDTVTMSGRENKFRIFPDVPGNWDDNGNAVGITKVLILFSGNYSKKNGIHF